MSRRRLAWILLFLSPAFFAVNMLMARYATFVPPNALALGRWLLVALLLLPFVWPSLVRHRHALAREWPQCQSNFRVSRAWNGFKQARVDNPHIVTLRG